MVTPRKPAASKKPTTARTTRKKVTPKVTVPKEVALDDSFPKYFAPIYSPEQKQSMGIAYQTLRDAGLPIPAELQIVDQWVAEVQQQQTNALEAQAKIESDRAAKANIEGPTYVRNCYPAPFNFRLDRQTEKRRIELKPRGVPGDMHPLKDEDLNDPILIMNVNTGLIELIPAGEAQIIVEKQTTNMSTRVHTPLAILRNENQQPYAPGAVKVEAEYNAQGITVAYTDPAIMQGQVSDRQVKQGFGGLTRAGQTPPPVVHSGFVPTAGNPAIVQHGPIQPNVQAKIVDDLARRKDLNGPAAGLGNVTVTVEPTRKT